MSSENNKNSIADTNEIFEFIKENKLATICCVQENSPYCFNCFYSLIEENNCLVFKSTPGSKHSDILTRNNKVAGTIIAEKLDLTKIKGIQFEGHVLTKGSETGLKATASYYMRFPFAVAMPGKIWVIELESIKFTNNAKGLGHKTHWQKESIE